MQQPTIIFFDIDGTLSRGGILAPQSHRMLLQLSQTDITIVIATGRCVARLPQDILRLFEQGIIDAIMCSNGQYGFAHSSTSNQQQVIVDYPFSKQQSHDIGEFINNENIVCKYELANSICWSQDPMHSELANNPTIASMFAKQQSYTVNKDCYKHENIYQCTVYHQPNSDNISNKHSNKFAHTDLNALALKELPWHEMSSNILPNDASKARGIIDICNHYGTTPKQAFAFGDGNNDIEMLQLVGYGVAMGDSCDELKHRADHVTGTIEENGIIKVLVDKGVLSK